MMLQPGKLNVLIDGQFGSTGKGLVASYLSQAAHVDIAITNASANAGHTFYLEGRKCITRHLPVSGVINQSSTIYLCAGAIIDPHILMREIDELKIDLNRICIHPRAAVINQQDIDLESKGSVKAIASTQKGVGRALQRKINRSAMLAWEHPALKHLVKELDLDFYLDQGCTALMEVPQGLDLSINSGLAYPYCTSREVTVAHALSEAQVHPAYLGNTIVTIRTFPIRVGHIVEGGVIVGDSGPFYPDSTELSWKQIGVPDEYTTNTRRVRRVASFSMLQYRRMLRLFRPDFIFLNFANYLTSKQLSSLLYKLPEVTHLGFGPRARDIKACKS